MHMYGIDRWTAAVYITGRAKDIKFFEGVSSLVSHILRGEVDGIIVS